MKYLFIGGCQDGEVLEVQDDCHFMNFRKPIGTNLLSEPIADLEKIEVAVEVDKYIMRIFRFTENGERLELVCFAIQNISDFSVLEKLFYNYRPNK